VTADPVDLDAAAHVADPHDLATVIYTSGTTGEPKGVMLDHANICWTIESLRLSISFPTDGFRLVSYLPMAHIAERVVTHYSGLSLGYDVTTCPDLRLLATSFRECCPELLFGVPRTYEKVHSGIRAVLGADPAQEQGFERALEVGFEVDAFRLRGEPLPPDLARRFEEVDATTLKPVRELLGLDALRVAVTAAAPIPVEILHFFRALGVPLAEMYGLSESCGPATWEADAVRLGTVGRAIPGLELRLDDDGEVLVRGGNVFRGYLDDPARTREALDDDGWLHTGDIGAIDDDGYLRIVDRKKELIITAGGKNISPANLEAALKAQPLIGQACVIGEGQPHLVALLVLDPDVAPVWAAQRGIAAATPEELARDDAVVAEVGAEVDEVNRRFSDAERIRKFVVLGDDWLPDSEELTPTMKLKRRSIALKYADVIAELYS
jgi:long-chain acyl-CoA synthetase